MELAMGSQIMDMVSQGIVSWRLIIQLHTSFETAYLFEGENAPKSKLSYCPWQPTHLMRGTMPNKIPMVAQYTVKSSVIIPSDSMPVMR